MRVRFFISLLILGGSFKPSLAQYNVQDFDLSDTTTQWFDQQIGVFNSELLTGQYAELRAISIKNSPYFNAKNWNVSRVFYRGELFEEVELLYDLETQKVFIYFRKPNHYSRLPIQLFIQNLQWFETAGSRFVNYQTMAPNRPIGIYDQIFIGDRVEVLMKRIKAERTDNLKIIYISTNRLLLGINGNYHRIRNRSALKNIFPKHKKQLRKALKKYQLANFNNASQEQLKKLGQFCNDLIKQE